MSEYYADLTTGNLVNVDIGVSGLHRRRALKRSVQRSGLLPIGRVLADSVKADSGIEIGDKSSHRGLWCHSGHGIDGNLIVNNKKM